MTSDLVSLLNDRDREQSVRVRQGVVESWDPDTGDNTIRVAGGQLLNVSALKAGSATLTVGDTVTLLSAGQRWFLLGNSITPGDPGTVPTWSGDITALNGQVDTIETVTIPAVQADVTVVQGDVVELNTVTVPAVQAVADAAQATADTAQSTATTAASDAATAAADAAAAAADAATALGKFPITTTDISDDAITTPKIAANAITATEIAAGAITATKLSADAIDGKTITGALFRTAASGQRVEINSPGAQNEVRLYSGKTGETTPGRVYSYGESFGAITAVESPTVDSSPLATILLTTRTDLTPDTSVIYGYADEINWSGLNAGLFLRENGSVQLLGNVSQAVEISGGSLLFNGDDVVTDTASQTLTNKNLSSLTNTFPFRIATGSHLFPTPATTLQTAAIVFPVGRFTSTPIVTATIRTSVDPAMHVAVSGESTTGFNLHFKRSTLVGTNVGWIAIQA